jgi:tRNA/rRNA methyltransferase
MAPDTLALSRFRLVLVAPRVPGNVGACARLAANFECEDWVIVDPQCPLDGWDAKKLATGTAREHLERIRLASSVAEAVADCHSAIGFTRRSGKIRKPTLELADATLLSDRPGKVALVFGNEETGLSASELSACTHVCALATSESMGSMNLSHAVAVVLARVYEQHGQRRAGRSARGRRGAETPALLGELEGLMDHWRELLTDAGMTTAGNPARLAESLRKIFARSSLTRREIRAIRGVLSKVQVKLGTRSRGRRVKP